MNRTASAEEVVKVSVLSTVLHCICEALPVETAVQVNAAIRRAYDSTAPTMPETQDAAQARALAPLLAALRR